MTRALAEAGKNIRSVAENKKIVEYSPVESSCV